VGIELNYGIMGVYTVKITYYPRFFMNDENNKPIDMNDGESHGSAVCEQELQQVKERYKYLLADFDNYRKREEKDRVARVQSAQADVLRDFLSLADNFERALNDMAIAQNSEQLQQKLAGFELIYKSLCKIIESYGVTEMKDTVTFDPAKHEALMFVSQADAPSGSIVAVLEKGYLFKGTVLRPARVSVAQ